MRDQARTAYLLVSTTLSTSLLAACGGGGSGAQPAAIPAPPPIQSQPSSAPPPPAAPASPSSQIPPAPALDTDEYRRSNGAAAHGAIKAYEAGASGKGVKVALLDSGINGQLSAFAGRVDPNSQDVVWDGQFDRGVTDTIGHGTAVASILAGARDNQGVMGVAFESTILSLNTATCDVWRQCKHYHSDLTKALDIARESGAKIVNMSLGGDTMGDELLQAIDRATRAGMVIVISAGNDAQISPSNFALEAARSAGNGNVIIAGAMDGGRNLAAFSNAGGAGADHFLVAIGAGIQAQDQNGNAATYNGTSYSAPVISGAAALLASAFPHLSGRQIVEILLATADDAGDAGNDYLFGRGILNIERAFSPQGQLKMAGYGTPMSVAQTPSGSSAMGDASATPASAVVLDGYDRAYRMQLPSAVAQAPVTRPLASLVQPGSLRTGTSVAGPLSVSITSLRNDRPQVLADTHGLRLGSEEAGRARLVAGIAMSRLSAAAKVALGISESGAMLQKRLSDAGGQAFLVARDSSTQAGFQAAPATSAGFRHTLAGGGLTVTHEMGEVAEPWLAARGNRRGYRVSSVTFDRRIGAHAFTLGVSRMEEDATLLGGAFSDAYYSGKASSYFADAGAGFRLGGGWTSNLAWRSGFTRAPSSGAMVEAGRLTTNAFSFDLARTDAFAAGDQLAVRISQPLRVTGGGFVMNVPTSYDYATGTTGFGRHLFGLVPKGREIDYEVSYAAPLFAGSVSANAFVRTQPGHVAERGSDIGAAFRFMSAF